MILHVTKAKYLADYQIEVWFNDGAHGVVDLNDPEFFRGSVFAPLQDKARFKDFIVDPELNTIVWSNGADVAPEYLESKIIASHFSPSDAHK